MPRGGARKGAGRKKKIRADMELAQVVRHPSSVPLIPIEVEEFDAPDDLTLDERRVWMELAPHAFANGTLTKASSLAFRILCRNVVLERRFGNSVTEQGNASHRGLIQRVDSELLAFGLAPCGKPMAGAQPVQKPANPLEKFLTRANG